jgi:hypothetical protein
MADASAGTYTSDFHSDQDKYINKQQRCTNCNELERNLKSALPELSSAQLIIKFLQKESHQEMIQKIILMIHVDLPITSMTYFKTTKMKIVIRRGYQSVISIIEHQLNSRTIITFNQCNQYQQVINTIY